MPATADLLHWTTLTAAVDETKAPNSFIKNTFFARDITVPTRHIELSYIRRGRQIAPFVKRNNAAIMVEGRNESFAMVQPAHIRIKRPMSPSDLMVNRHPGNQIFAGADAIEAAMREYMANELEMMLDDCTNSEEWLAAMALRGVIAYSVDDEESFTITFPRSATNDFALSGSDRWDQSGSSPRVTMGQVQGIINNAVGLNATDVILGADAAEAFLANVEANTLLNVLRFNTGTLDFTTNIQENGALFLGTYVHGIRIWTYTRQLNVNGVATDLIRPKYAEFICRTPSAQMGFYFGAIEDMKAIGAGKLLQTKRFSKTYDNEDPSARMILVESNPMPFIRRPDATASVQVIS